MLKVSLIVISDQLFWIFSVLLVVEILSQLFQFESLGKIFVQFYILAIHALVGITLASFETRTLVYLFVVLIAFVNGLRFFMYRLPILHRSGIRRFWFDLFTIIALGVLMYFIDPLIPFTDVPVYSHTVQYSILGGLSLVLIYEMLQRAYKTGIHMDDFLPRSGFSFLLVLLTFIIGIGLLISTYFDINLATKFFAIIIYVGIIMFINIVAQLNSRDPEYYSLLYLAPTFVMVFAFIQLITLGG